MTAPTKPFLVYAMTELPPAPDGRKRGEQVLIGQFDTKPEQDDFFNGQRAIWLRGGMAPEVKEIVRGQTHGARQHEAGEADLMALGLAALLGGATDAQTVAASDADVGPASGITQLALAIA